MNAGPSYSDSDLLGRSWRRSAGGRPLVLGHRGARHAAPENTLAAFELAAREGADGSELDVRIDGAGELVVLHDTSLERVTAGGDRRHVEDVSNRELASIDVGNGERVPKLADVLVWARARNQRINVEVKHDVRRPRELVARVIALVQSTPDAPERLLLSCFHPGIVRALSRSLPRVPVAWLVHSKQRVLRRAPAWQLLGAVAVHPESVLVTERALFRLKRGGAIVNVWTVNDPERAVLLAKLGVDGIISDAPGRILRAL